MRDAIQYIRVSSDEQAKGGSLSAQTREGGEYALKRELAIVRMFRDVETAKSTGREDFAKMLKFLKKQKKPVVLLVEKTDRLYRNYGDMEDVKRLVQSKGHEVHLYKEGEILSPSTPSHTWLVHYFKVAMATNYVENLSEEIKKGHKEKLLRGEWPHKAPAGYKNDRNTKNVVVDPQTSEYVKQAFEIFATGIYSIERLNQKLFEEGYIYRPHKPKMGKAGLAKLLKNPFYIGEMKVDDVSYPGKHEPIISKSTWLKAQEAFRKDGKPLKYNTHDFKYNHLITCHECGSSLVGEYKKGGRYTYYRCAARKQGCSQGYISEKKLDDAFDRFIKCLALSEKIRAEILDGASALAEDNRAIGEMATAKIEIARYKTLMKRALHEMVEGNVDAALYKELTADYQACIRKLEAKLEKLTHEDIDFYELARMLVELPRTLSEKWFRAKNEQKTKILNFVSANFSIEGEKLHYGLKEPFSLIGKTALSKAWWSIGDSNS